MLLSVYLIGAVVTATGALVAAESLGDGRMPRPRHRGWLTVSAGALWPVLLIGLVQLAVVAAVAKTMTGAKVRRSEAMIRRNEVLTLY
ncbi:MAG: hypothetical protein JWR32_57 [Mycobacterium sp.]|nr:hypothetical protein [Mycobacterium sp.]